MAWMTGWPSWVAVAAVGVLALRVMVKMNRLAYWMQEAHPHPLETRRVQRVSIQATGDFLVGVGVFLILKDGLLHVHVAILGVLFRLAWFIWVPWSGEVHAETIEPDESVEVIEPAYPDLEDPDSVERWLSEED